MDREKDATLDTSTDDLSDDDLDRIVASGLVEEEGAPGQVKVLECPDCGRSDLSYVAGMETGHQYRCPHCGYEGALAVERWRAVADLRREAGME